MSEFDRPIVSARLAPVQGEDDASCSGMTYTYQLTSRGLAIKARVARRFLESKTPRVRDADDTDRGAET